MEKSHQDEASWEGRGLLEFRAVDWEFQN